MTREEKDQEIWKPIVGYEEYEVSNKGRIKRLAIDCVYYIRQKLKRLDDVEEKKNEIKRLEKQLAELKRNK